MKASVIPLGQYNNEIEQFIYEICYRPIWEAVSAYIYIKIRAFLISRMPELNTLIQLCSLI